MGVGPPIYPLAHNIYVRDEPTEQCSAPFVPLEPRESKWGAGQEFPAVKWTGKWCEQGVVGSCGLLLCVVRVTRVE